jgi:thymidylate synthase
MYQRSADLFLGLPFNIASTATLLYILCNLCDKKPGDVIISIGDAHIYEEHIEQVNEQLTNECYPFPTMKINKKCETLDEVEQLEFSDFKLENYKCNKSIKAKMVV